jgi:hypothetical protein
MRKFGLVMSSLSPLGKADTSSSSLFQAATPTMMQRAELKLSDIAESLQEDWIDLAVQLGLTDTEIQDLKKVQGPWGHRRSWVPGKVSLGSAIPYYSTPFDWPTPSWPNAHLGVGHPRGDFFFFCQSTRLCLAHCSYDMFHHFVAMKFTCDRFNSKKWPHPRSLRPLDGS